MPQSWNDCTQSWNDWLRSTRKDQGLSLKKTAELLNLSDELLRLVEFGRRKFSEDEFLRWLGVFNLPAPESGFPLATSEELERRATWKKYKQTKKLSIKKSQVETPWNIWVQQVRAKSGYTLKVAIERMQAASVADLKYMTVTTLNDVERGHRKFKDYELDAWLKAFSLDHTEVEIPIANALSERARARAIETAKKHRGKPSNIPAVVEVSEESSSREDLLEKVSRIVNNKSLPDEFVTHLVDRMRLEVMNFLGL